MQVTIFENIFSKNPFYISVSDALSRISSGKSMALVNEIRGTLDKSKSQKLKANLPSVCFSGRFGSDRKDEQIIEHSGFIVLDFDDLLNDALEEKPEFEEFIIMALEWGQPDGLVVNEEYRRAERAKGHGMFWLDNEKYDDLIIDGLRVSTSTEFS